MLVRILLFLGALVLVFLLGWGTWAGVAWTRYGHPAPGALADTTITRFLPNAEVAEHQERLVDSPAQRVSIQPSDSVWKIPRSRAASFGSASFCFANPTRLAVPPHSHS